MDKVRLPDRRKPPKQARFPDAPVRASMHASKLVAGAGVSGSGPLVGSIFSSRLQEKHGKRQSRYRILLCVLAAVDSESTTNQALRNYRCILYWRQLLIGQGAGRKRRLTYGLVSRL
jgi:hypothetical protein